jgi:SM-20-related protein
LLKTFESLINSFIETKVGIADNFLGAQLAADLKENLERLHSNDQMDAARTGNTVLQQDKLFRSDVIHWLDREHRDVHENSFFDLMDNFVEHLNSTCYTGITSYEFHYTLYPIGSFYKRHLDQFRSDDSRKYSMIMYLNEDWQPKDGGELCVYHLAGQQHISPDNGKGVFFKSSEMEHEVLVTNKPRMSITGWLKG